MSARVGWIQIDCRDPDGLRAFWAEVLGLKDDPAPAPPAFRCLAAGSPAGVGICFQRVPEPKVVKNRVHLDIVVSDIAATTTLIEGLGGHRRGTPSDHHEAGWSWRTMADPGGNEFCLVPAPDDPG